MIVPKFFKSFVYFTFALLVFMLTHNGAALPAKVLPTDTCSLLPPGELQKVLEQHFGAPQRSTAPAAYPGLPSGTECDYMAQNGLTRKVVFIFYADPSAAGAKETFGKLSMWFAPKSRPSGIGDAAYIDGDHAIHVLKGKVRYYINIIPIGTITPQKEKQLRDLAVSVAARI